MLECLDYLLILLRVFNLPSLELAFINASDFTMSSIKLIKKTLIILNILNSKILTPFKEGIYIVLRKIYIKKSNIIVVLEICGIYQND